MTRKKDNLENDHLLHDIIAKTQTLLDGGCGFISKEHKIKAAPTWNLTV